MRWLKGSFREWFVAIILVLAGTALLHSRWASRALADEGGGDPGSGEECVNN